MKYGENPTLEKNKRFTTNTGSTDIDYTIDTILDGTTEYVLFSTDRGNTV